MRAYSSDQFFRTEATAGIAVLTAICLALVFANTSLAALYEAVKGITLPALALPGTEDHAARTLSDCVADLALALMFFVYAVMLRCGALARGQARTDHWLAIGVVGGAMIVVPAILVFALLGSSVGDGGGLLPPQTGWLIVAGGEVALTAIILAALRDRIDPAVAAFALNLAMMSCLAAVILMSVGRFEALDGLPLIALSAAVLAFIGLRLKPRLPGWSYLAIGGVLWLVLLQTGVHAPLAGVLTGLFVPLAVPVIGRSGSVAMRIGQIHRPTVFITLPIMVFLNSGIDFAALGGTPDAASNAAIPVYFLLPLALIVGKPLAVLLAGRGLVAAGYGPPALQEDPRQIWLIAALATISVGCGFGFLTYAGLPIAAESGIRLGLMLSSLIAAAWIFVLVTGRLSLSERQRRLLLLGLGPVAGASLIMLVAFPGLDDASPAANNAVQILLLAVFALSAFGSVTLVKAAPDTGPAPSFLLLEHQGAIAGNGGSTMPKTRQVAETPDRDRPVLDLETPVVVTPADDRKRAPLETEATPSPSPGRPEPDAPASTRVPGVDDRASVPDPSQKTDDRAKAKRGSGIVGPDTNLEDLDFSEIRGL